MTVHSLQELADISTEQEDIQTRLDEVNATAATIADQAASYIKQLHTAMLDGVEEWVNQQNAVFEAAEYGHTLSDVENKLSSHSAFTASLATQKQVRLLVAG